MIDWLTLTSETRAKRYKINMQFADESGSSKTLAGLNNSWFGELL